MSTNPIKNIVLYALMAALTAIVFYYNLLLGGLCLGLCAIVIAADIVSRKQDKKQFDEKLFSARQEVEAVRAEKLVDLPLPSALVNRFGMIINENACFKSTFGANNRSTRGRYLHKIIKVRIDDLEDSKPYSFQWKDKNYLIIDKQYKEKNNRMHLLNFIELGLKKAMDTALRVNETVFCYILIDNYDDVYKSLSPVDRSAVFGKIAVLLSDWAERFDGIIQEYENDHYMMIFSRDQLSKMQDEKFRILDEVREVHSEIKVTLSMGIGISEKHLSLIALDNLSKTALDMALARGGDQCVVRNDEKMSFYGGKTEATEKRTKVKARVKGSALRELMYNSDNIIIMGHPMPDMDCVGAAIGLIGAARSINRDCRFVLREVNDGIRSLLEYIQQDERYRNIFITPEETEKYIKDESLLIVVDTQNRHYIECPELLDKVNNTIVIDHHRRSGESIGTILFSYIETYSSSTCELITELLEYFDEDEKELMNKIEANALLAGICMDTKMFTVKTGVRTFEAAAALKRKGADTAIAKKLLAGDLMTYGLKADAVRSAMIYNHIAVSTMISESPNANVIAAQAADELLSIKDVEASFVILNTKQIYMISGRSNGEVNVQLIMEKLGGGGHLTMAGAQLYGLDSMDAAKARLLEAIEEYIKEKSTDGKANDARSN